jgi:phosphoribosyl 1,2-cyclic phosphodiesterase
MRFASLGSGSEGNALLIQSGKTCVLMDCGFSMKETALRLSRIGLSVEHINGIVVTHEHGDHIAGVARLARKHAIPVWLTHGTRKMLGTKLDGLPSLTEISSHQSFSIGGLHLQPYAVPHDAAEPVQFIFSDGAKRLGVLTDAGCITPHIEAMLNGCDALVLECNHDAALLANGDYPYHLKQRVGGRLGHLNNDDAATLLTKIDTQRLQHIVAAHLSSKNNTRELAVAALSAALSCEANWITVATQQQGFGWCELK